MKTGRIYLWDNIKFILMFFIVVTHCMCMYMPSNNFGKWCHYIWIFTLTYTMPLFTIISGFFYKKRTLDYLLKNYMMPCIIFSIINFVVGYMVHWPQYYDASWKEIIKMLPAMYSLWYLWALFIYGIITPFLKKHLGTGGVIALSIVIISISSFWCTKTFNISRVLGFYPYYLLGILLSEHKEFVYKFNNSYKAYSILIFIAFTALYFVADTFIPGIAVKADSGIPQPFNKFGIFIKAFSYIANTILAISFIGLMPDKELPISRLGAKTMYCYYWHMTPIFILGYGICSQFRGEWYDFLITMFSVPLLTLIFYTKICERITNKMLFIKK